MFTRKYRVTCFCIDSRLECLSDSILRQFCILCESCLVLPRSVLRRVRETVEILFQCLCLPLNCGRTFSLEVGHRVGFCHGLVDH